MISRPTAAVLACALSLALAGCGNGVTVEGRPTSIPTAPTVSYAPPSRALRTPTPQPTPTEDRRTAPGPEVTVKAVGGSMLVHAVTYSWQKTGFGEKSVDATYDYLVLDLEVSALDGEPMLLPANIRAIQQGGPSLNPVFGKDGNQPVLATKVLRPQETVRGFVVYDLPRGDSTIEVFDELGAKVGEMKIPGA
ncbi:hypothetical protein GCM10027418_25220 [Mariniluteicoccus endophyticus]